MTQGWGKEQSCGSGSGRIGIILANPNRHPGPAPDPELDLESDPEYDPESNTDEYPFNQM
jgi:hypothetical protein